MCSVRVRDTQSSTDQSMRCLHESNNLSTIPANPCVLCGKKKKSYYSHHKISTLMRYCENEPPPHSCICLAHLVKAQREHPEHFIPKWKKPNHDTHSVVMSLRGVEAPLQLYNSKGASKSVKEQHEA